MNIQLNIPSISSAFDFFFFFLRTRDIINRNNGEIGKLAYAWNTIRIHSVSAMSLKMVSGTRSCIFFPSTPPLRISIRTRIILAEMLCSKVYHPRPHLRSTISLYYARIRGAQDRKRQVMHGTQHLIRYAARGGSSSIARRGVELSPPDDTISRVSINLYYRYTNNLSSREITGKSGSRYPCSLYLQTR